MTIANFVKELREKTGAGILDCKKALEECAHDFEKAIDFLRKKGLASAAKKSGNLAAEGLIALKVKNHCGVIIEINSQTDFVAKNSQFQNLTYEVVNAALNVNNLEELKAAKLKNDKTVDEIIVENIASIGENLQLRRFQKLKVNHGIIASYTHNHVAEGLGKIGVLVAIESHAPVEKLHQFGKQIAMHIAASKPYSLDITGLSQDLIAREKNIAHEQAKASGKPDNVVEKMAEGRMRKFYEESVLLEQISVLDGKTKISELITTTEKELGNDIKIVDFIRYEVGEGIVQETKNFADEVAAAVKQK